MLSREENSRVQPSRTDHLGGASHRGLVRNFSTCFAPIVCLISLTSVLSLSSTSVLSLLYLSTFISSSTTSVPLSLPPPPQFSPLSTVVLLPVSSLPDPSEPPSPTRPFSLPPLPQHLVSPPFRISHLHIPIDSDSLSLSPFFSTTFQNSTRCLKSGDGTVPFVSLNAVQGWRSPGAQLIRVTSGAYAIDDAKTLAAATLFCYFWAEKNLKYYLRSVFAI